MRVSGDFGALDAGMTVAVGVLDQAPGDWDKVIETNLNACFLLSKLAAQSMIKQCGLSKLNLKTNDGFEGQGAIQRF
jgi:NAD(P)-dependent dehydrogenase (short-subunit alcohol dehydrogenase family)